MQSLHEQEFRGIHRGVREVRNRAISGLDSHRPLSTADRNSGGLDCGPQAVHEAKGAIGPRGRRDDGELCVAEAPDGIGDAAGVPEHHADLIRQPRHLITGGVIIAVELRLRREHHAGERLAAAGGIGADLSSPASQAPHVVEPGA